VWTVFQGFVPASFRIFHPENLFDCFQISCAFCFRMMPRVNRPRGSASLVVIVLAVATLVCGSASGQSVPSATARSNSDRNSFQCIDGVLTPVRINPSSGDAECISRDGVNCVWATSPPECASILTSNPLPSSALTCGVHHARVQGNSDGYNGFEHWCILARVYFALPAEASTVASYALAAAGRTQTCLNANISLAQEGRLRSISGTTPSPQQFQCIAGVFTPLRLNTAGDVQCLSNDGRNCVWASSDAGCTSSLVGSGSNNNPTSALTCGVLHALYQPQAGDGYNGLNHWCFLGRVRLASAVEAAMFTEYAATSGDVPNTSACLAAALGPVAFPSFQYEPAPLVETADSKTDMGIAGFTFSAWVRPAARVYGMVVSRDRSGVSTNQFRLHSTLDGRLAAAGLNIPFIIGGTAVGQDPNGYATLLTTRQPLALHTWSHVVLQRSNDGKVFTLWLNGTIQAQITTHMALDNTKLEHMRLGSRYPADGDDGSDPFVGRIRNALWYPNSMSAQWIARNFEADQPLPFEASCVPSTGTSSSGIGPPSEPSACPLSDNVVFTCDGHGRAVIVNITVRVISTDNVYALMGSPSVIAYDVATCNRIYQLCPAGSPYTGLVPSARSRSVGSPITNAALGASGVLTPPPHAPDWSVLFAPSKCTDGDLSTFCHSNCGGMQQQLQITLASAVLVGEVRLWNRLDGSRDRINGFQLYLSMQSGAAALSASTLVYTDSPVAHHENDLADGEGYPISIPIPGGILSQVVTIVLPSAVCLNLQEVQVVPVAPATTTAPSTTTPGTALSRSSSTGATDATSGLYPILLVAPQLTVAPGVAQTFRFVFSTSVAPTQSFALTILQNGVALPTLVVLLASTTSDRYFEYTAPTAVGSYVLTFSLSANGANAYQYKAPDSVTVVVRQPQLACGYGGLDFRSVQWEAASAAPVPGSAGSCRHIVDAKQRRSLRASRAAKHLLQPRARSESHEDYSDDVSLLSVSLFFFSSLVGREFWGSDARNQIVLSICGALTSGDTIGCWAGDARSAVCQVDQYTGIAYDAGHWNAAAPPTWSRTPDGNGVTYSMTGASGCASVVVLQCASSQSQWATVQRSGTCNPTLTLQTPLACPPVQLVFAPPPTSPATTAVINPAASSFYPVTVTPASFPALWAATNLSVTCTYPGSVSGSLVTFFTTAAAPLTIPSGAMRIPAINISLPRFLDAPIPAAGRPRTVNATCTFSTSGPSSLLSVGPSAVQTLTMVDAGSISPTSGGGGSSTGAPSSLPPRDPSLLCRPNTTGVVLPSSSSSSPASTSIYPLRSPTGYTNPSITDWGYPNDRMWLDLVGDGVRNDYGRWVWDPPSTFYSIAVRNSSNQHTLPDEWLLVNGCVARNPDGPRVYRVLPALSNYYVNPNGYANPVITDWGYVQDRQYWDVVGDGLRNDYGRWVGDPGTLHYSIAIRGALSQHTQAGEFVLRNGTLIDRRMKPPVQPVGLSGASTGAGDAASGSTGHSSGGSTGASTGGSSSADTRCPLSDKVVFTCDGHGRAVIVNSTVRVISTDNVYALMGSPSVIAYDVATCNRIYQLCPAGSPYTGLVPSARSRSVGSPITNAALGASGVLTPPPHAPDWSVLFAPSKCTDGDLSTFCHSNCGGMQQQLQITLASAVLVGEVRLWNRLDGSRDRINGFQLYLSMQSGAAALSASTLVYTDSPVAHHENDLADGEGYPISIPIPGGILSQVVTIVLPSAVCLNLQEVQVVPVAPATTTASTAAVVAAPSATASSTTTPGTTSWRSSTGTWVISSDGSSGVVLTPTASSTGTSGLSVTAVRVTLTIEVVITSSSQAGALQQLLMEIAGVLGINPSRIAGISLVAQNMNIQTVRWRVLESSSTTSPSAETTSTITFSMRSIGMLPQDASRA
jgi:hypothetical protein